MQFKNFAARLIDEWEPEMRSVCTYLQAQICQCEQTTCSWTLKMDCTLGALNACGPANNLIWMMEAIAPVAFAKAALDPAGELVWKWETDKSLTQCLLQSLYIFARLRAASANWTKEDIALAIWAIWLWDMTKTMEPEAEKMKSQLQERCPILQQFNLSSGRAQSLAFRLSHVLPEPSLESLHEAEAFFMMSPKAWSRWTGRCVQ